MKPRTYSTTGIILARKNYGEADRILNLYTKDYGRISLIAKGVRRPKSKKRGHLEVFNLLALSAAKGKGLDILLEAETIDSFSGIRKNLNKVSLAYFLMEVVGKTTREEERNERLYQLLLNYLKLVEENGQHRKIKDEFVYEILVLLGFWPEGKKLGNPEEKLEEVAERQMATRRVGKALLS